MTGDSSRRILRAHLKEVPLHRVIVRAVEAGILENISFPRPILDVGCGDGHFATVVFQQCADVGIDKDMKDAAEASQRGAYRLVTRASSYALPFPDAHFASVLSNCVLEHIPDLDTTLREISRVLRPEGLFVCTVIGEHFPDYLTSAPAWSRGGLGRARRTYVDWFNRKAVHHHFDSPERWQERFKRAGLRVRRWRYYLSERATHAMHWSHYVSLPHLLFRRLTGRWVPFPGLMDRPFWVRRLLPYTDEPEPASGSCIAFECVRSDSITVV
jgi:SAM-dependent methyltransferase